MPWNADWPLGSVSVKANRVTGDQNTKYVQDTMGNAAVGNNTNTTRDHFWNVDPNLNGRHRFIKSPAFTVGGNPADPIGGAGCDGTLYLKTTNARAEWFHRNSQGIFQVTPSFKTGTVVVTSNDAFVNITDVPANVYGILYMWRQTTTHMQAGTFVSGAATVSSFSTRMKIQGSDEEFWYELGNGAAAVGLNIRVRRSQEASGTANYRVLYWAI